MTIDGVYVLGSYHVSQQNTQTGKLTPDMLDSVLALALSYASQSVPGMRSAPKICS